MKYLLDTNIISEPMKLKPSRLVMNRLALDGIFSCTSATVWHELNHGMQLLPNGNRKTGISDYLSQIDKDGFQILPFCKHSAEWLAKERVRLKQEGIIATKYDSEIAAVSCINNLILVTRNIEDYKHFKGLQLENWFES